MKKNVNLSSFTFRVELWIRFFFRVFFSIQQCVDFISKRFFRAFSRFFENFRNVCAFDSFVDVHFLFWIAFASRCSRWISFLLVTFSFSLLHFFDVFWYAMTLNDLLVEFFRIREKFVSFYILNVQKIDTINCRFANEKKNTKKNSKKNWFIAKHRLKSR